MHTTDIHWGNGISLGKISTQINTLKPVQLSLVVEINDFSNSWDIWVYPTKQTKFKDDVLVVQKLNKEALLFLEKGGNILLTVEKGDIKPNKGGEVGIGFSSIFWNTAWTAGQKPHTLGILCDPNHSALKEFPTEYHSNWQWWDAMSHSNAISLESFSTDVLPIVRVIDDWVTNRRLALIFEVKAGKGNILISGIDLINELENRPEAQQLRYSLIRYMNSTDFNPKAELDIVEIKQLLTQNKS